MLSLKCTHGLWIYRHETLSVMELSHLLHCCCFSAWLNLAKSCLRLYHIKCWVAWIIGAIWTSSMIVASIGHMLVWMAICLQWYSDCNFYLSVVGIIAAAQTELVFLLISWTLILALLLQILLVYPHYWDLDNYWALMVQYICLIIQYIIFNKVISFFCYCNLI